MKRVLVTGGAGYVGSHVCKALALAGILPVTFDSLVTGHAWAVRWGPLVRGDIRDRAALEAAFAAHRPEAVIHLAALSLVGRSSQDPAPYYDVNLGGSLALVETMLRHGTRSIVFSSTCAVYGHPQAPLLDEDHPIAPVSPYGATKAAVESLLRDCGAAYGLEAVVLRYFNAAGADPDGEIGEAHDPETHLVPLAVACALGGMPALTVFGTDYPTPDGTCLRDYVHVGDLALAHVQALAHAAGRPGFQAFNLGGGHGHSVKEVIRAVERATGRPVPFTAAARRPGDPARLVAAADRAARDLGWHPKWATLDAVVASAVAWHAKAGAGLSGEGLSS